MTRLSHRQRQLLLYRGMPAADVARVMRIPVAEVLAMWAELRGRGVVAGAVEPFVDEQLTLEQTDEMMRTNAAPKPRP